MMDREQVEALVATRVGEVLVKDLENHRSFVSRQIKFATALLSLVVGAGITAFYFSYGSSIDDISNRADKRVDAAVEGASAASERAIKGIVAGVLDYRVDEELQNRLWVSVSERVGAKATTDLIDKQIEGRVESEEIQRLIDALTEKRVRARIGTELEKGEFRKRLDEAVEAVRSQLEQKLGAASLRDAVLNAAPIGSVVAWPGDSAPDGWALCDGATIKSSWSRTLKGILKSDRLPDYRGYFLRGLAPKWGREKEGHPKYTLFDHANQSRVGGPHVGNPQESRTGAPKELDGIDGKAPRLGDDWVRIKDGGSGPYLIPVHTHSRYDGWDEETRPVNIAVNWIIKVK